MSGAKVWLVTAGEYSDFHIVAAFTTEALAEEYASHTKGSYGRGTADVEEWDLNDALPELKEWLELTTAIDGECQVVKDEAVTSSQWVTQKLPAASRSRFHPDQASMSPIYGFPVPTVTVTTEGVDHDRVRRVHSEALALAKASVDVFLSPIPGEESLYPSPVNYQIGHDLSARLNADLPWRVRSENEGWGVVITLLRQAGVDADAAYQLGKGVWQGDDAAVAEVDRVLGVGVAQ